MFFARRDEQWYEDNLREGDYVVAAFDGDKIIGKGIVMELAADEMDTESLRQFAHAYAPNKLAGDLCGTFVDPEYAGQGIQRRIIERREALMSSGNAEYLITVTLPQNYKSIASCLKSGFTIEGTGKSDAEGNPWLYFLCKRFEKSSNLERKQSKEVVTISADDEIQIVERIRSGWHGVKLEAAEDKSQSPLMTLVK
tara:strand:- start:323731 stop:324321 length:591 start_codon:yes stop_codon:yes gene_type:complete